MEKLPVKVVNYPSSRYRLAQEEVEAMQFKDMATAQEIMKWIKQGYYDVMSGKWEYMTLKTKGGEKRAWPGDWVIKYMGNVYVCPGDLFDVMFNKLIDMQFIG